MKNTTSSGIFIGYDRNPTAFKIYDYINNKIVLARAVEFFEDTSNYITPAYYPDTIDFIKYYEKGGNINDNNNSTSFHNNNNDNDDNINTNTNNINNESINKILIK
ncbi:hypothetical protein BCR32DRAFT_287054 [Anaeromyces robustus]|uniref:Retroviral polymerase SH3-like domain-containing protein n=1 Tax=Anaeromyces robustus TaxID=1754192 RepID=A0A1Y1VTK2_9FUNG|nr:hypothetical protein BCR32DRAFT_287054 [Anaeromyces robustus]|eukprot:ORX64513.1 hypothetical protein BCR32DRAFT_287054 [Anaeromyces robustus]